MRPAAQLLVIESELVPDLLVRAGPEALDRPSVCAGWSVRDVVAHCAAALGDLVAGTLGTFTPEENQVAVEARRSWPLDRVIAELVGVYPTAASRIDELNGLVDGLGVGEWIHGGDIREPLGEVDAYCSRGTEMAVELLVDRSVERRVPALTVSIDGVARSFGRGPTRGELATDTETFVRLVSGRRPDPARYVLDGDVDAASLVLFG